MKLNVSERLSVGELFVKQAGLSDLQLMKDIEEKVEIKTPEREEIELKIVQSDGNYRWNWKAEKAKDLSVNFSKAELRWLKKRVKELDNEKAITFGMLDLCVKIQDEEEKEK